MSFILDALKKSESDRQRQSGPSLFEVKVAPPKRRLPVWAVAIAILLLVNFIVISWMLLRRPAAQQAGTAGTAPAAAPPAAAMANQAVAGAIGHSDVAPGPTARALAPGGPAPSGGAAADSATTGREEAPAAGSSLGAARPASSQPGVAPPLANTDTDRARPPPGADAASDDAPAVEPSAAPGSGGPGGTTGDLPLYQQIVSSDGLPALHLDLHVFADRPQDRFVMINMHRLGEGDSLPSGVQVEAIRPDGVVMTYRGIRFLLPRN